MQQAPQQTSELVPTRFVWPYGGRQVCRPRRAPVPPPRTVAHSRLGAWVALTLTPHARQVHVCGSFTNWLTPIPMAPDGTGGGKVFAVVCNLPPGCVTPAASSLGETTPQRTAASHRLHAAHLGLSPGCKYWSACPPAAPPFCSDWETLAGAPWCVRAPAALCRYHQYKFIVDGKWQHEEGQAFVTDPLGNTNNWCAHSRAGSAAQSAGCAARGKQCTTDWTGAPPVTGCL